jgi:hypothetical protein
MTLVDGAQLQFSHRVRVFLDRKFPDRWIGTRRPILWPFILQIWLISFFKGFVKDVVDFEKTQDANESRDSRQCLAAPGEKLNIALCVVPLMVPILRSTEHRRNFVMPSV